MRVNSNLPSPCCFVNSHANSSLSNSVLLAYASRRTRLLAFQVKEKDGLLFHLERNAGQLQSAIAMLLRQQPCKLKPVQQCATCICFPKNKAACLPSEREGRPSLSLGTQCGSTPICHRHAASSTAMQTQSCPTVCYLHMLPEEQGCLPSK